MHSNKINPIYNIVDLFDFMSLIKSNNDNLKNPNISLKMILSFSIKLIGCNRVIQCHYSNFESRDMILMSLKNLHFEQYDCEVSS